MLIKEKHVSNVNYNIYSFQKTNTNSENKHLELSKKKSFSLPIKVSPLAQKSVCELPLRPGTMLQTPGLASADHAWDGHVGMK